MDRVTLGLGVLVTLADGGSGLVHFNDEAFHRLAGHVRICADDDDTGRGAVGQLDRCGH